MSSKNMILAHNKGYVLHITTIAIGYSTIRLPVESEKDARIIVDICSLFGIYDNPISNKTLASDLLSISKKHDTTTIYLYCETIDFTNPKKVIETLLHFVGVLRYERGNRSSYCRPFKKAVLHYYPTDVYVEQIKL